MHGQMESSSKLPLVLASVAMLFEMCIPVERHCIPPAVCMVALGAPTYQYPLKTFPPSSNIMDH